PMNQQTTHHASQALPLVGAVYFYWYEWDTYAGEWGNWLNGVHNTPLYGYYDSRTLADNVRSILLAADWGVTHLYMDYWGQGWRGEDGEPRESTVLKAAERVHALGYRLFLGLYQDGENFAMREFWRNVSERRDTVYWMRQYARSPVWTWLGGKPFQMVYSRNGAPQLSEEHAGFQQWLRERYGTVERLNAEWGTRYQDFGQIRLDVYSTDFLRAHSIEYQYEVWRRDWQKLEELIRQEFGLPGLSVSLDVGYAPFLGFGYERFARVFGGAHSYAGIFGEPHEQDAERFLQAAVTRQCGGVFFDHLKHRYFDWGIRVPGTGYPPEPHHDDRFWVGNLMRGVDGVLHLSWNEWWEGSNLEPSFEGGKRFCETNLLYSTLWQLTYPRPQGEAPVALLVNDWLFESGQGDPNDLYHAVQALRAIQAPFEVVLQSEADAERLRRYRVVVAPAGGAGFGFNRQREPVARVLREWMQQGRHTLVVSASPVDWTGQTVPATSTAPTATATGRWNFFVDVGVEGDERVLQGGFSAREDWGALPPGAYGAGTRATVRWTPGTGTSTTLLLPALPNSNLLLRWHGNVLWQHAVRVFVNETLAGEVTLEPGWRMYEMPLPASAVGMSRVLEVRWQFSEAVIPRERDPRRLAGEGRACNLALDWIQICTPDVPPGERESVPWQPTDLARFSEGETFRAPLSRRRGAVPAGEVLSRYSDGVPRDVFTTVGGSRLLLVNGIFTDDPRWWAKTVEEIAGIPCGKYLRLQDGRLPDTPDLMSASLWAGSSCFLLLENRTGAAQALRLHPPQKEDLPLAEVTTLTLDGRHFLPRQVQSLPFEDTVHYVAAYQLVYAPVQVNAPAWTAFPGCKARLPLTVRNLLPEPVALTLQLGAKIASVRGEPVALRLAPAESRRVELPCEVKPFADWGVKTVYVEATWRGREGQEEKAFFLRPLTVGRNAEVRLLSTAVSSHSPVVTVTNAPTTAHGEVTWWHPARDVPGETAREVEVVFAGARLQVGDLREGERRELRLPIPFTTQVQARQTPLTLRWRDSAGVHERTVSLTVTTAPRRLPASRSGQVASLLVANADEARGVPLTVSLPTALRGRRWQVCLPDGTPLPTHTSGGNLHFVVPPARWLWRVDVGSPGDERVLLRGMAQREQWAQGNTVRWIPGEGRETVLRVPVPREGTYRLLLHGQVLWENRVAVFVDGRKVGEYGLRPGWRTLVVALPPRRSSGQSVEVRLLFERMHRPVERGAGEDRRVCNFALDWLALEQAETAGALVLAVNPLRRDASSPLRVQAGGGVVRIDNGVLELEWREEAGGTLTRFYSKRTGRDYAAQGGGVGIGTFGRTDPRRPAQQSHQFIVDDIRWQREGRASVRLLEHNPVWATVEVTAGGGDLPLRATQRYRVFAGLPLVEMAVQVQPLSAEAEELVALEARFAARWWTKSYPNFVGMGDNPAELFGPKVHFGWRLGDWVPPVLTLFHPGDLSESLSLLIVQNEGCGGVRQGFWGAERNRPSDSRQFATIELIAQPVMPVRLRLWLWLHEGYHTHARQMRQRLMQPVPIAFLQ
ncbi:MAG: beta-galactosidase, partial [Armatimonadota bacterium]|nr:beta-galactosidase [Armatimonadota bacterium]